MKRLTRLIGLILSLCAVISFTSCSRERVVETKEGENVVIYNSYGEYMRAATLHYGMRDETFRYKVYDICVTINEYRGGGGDVVIPDTLKVVLNGTEVKELPVIAIEENVFYQNKSVTNLTIGSNILWIGDNAFYQCENLRAVNMSPSIRELGGSVFAGCKRLKSIIIPANVKDVPTSAFNGCSMLTKVVIEAKGDGTDSEKALYGSSFANCGRLTTIWIPADITAIDGSVFVNSARPTIFGTETSKAAVFAAEGKLDFVISTRADFDLVARQYKPSLVLDDDVVGKFSVGDTADCGTFTIHLKEAKYYSQLGDLKAEDGYTYAALYFDIKNTTAGTHYFEGLNVECKSYAEADDGYFKYTKEPIMLATSVLKCRYPVGEVGPKGTLSGVMVFKVYREFTYLTVDFQSYKQAGDEDSAKFKVQ